MADKTAKEIDGTEAVSDGGNTGGTADACSIIMVTMVNHMG